MNEHLIMHAVLRNEWYVDNNVVAFLFERSVVGMFQVVSSQKDESRGLLPDLQKPQESANEQDDDDDDIDEEMELQRKIQELQMKLLSKQKKK